MPDHFSEAMSPSKFISLCVINRLMKSIFLYSCTCTFMKFLQFQSTIEQTFTSSCRQSVSHDLYLVRVKQLKSHFAVWQSIKSDQLVRTPNLPINLLWNKEIEWPRSFSGGPSKIIWTIAVALPLTNASYLSISVLKCGTMKLDEIMDDVFVLGGYSKCINKWRIEY